MTIKKVKEFRVEHEFKIDKKRYRIAEFENRRRVTLERVYHPLTPKWLRKHPRRTYTVKHLRLMLEKGRALRVGIWEER